jgi:asparagine synthase (glutamine-hydrolysing)
MPEQYDFLALGAPRFCDPNLARCAVEHGAVVAWRQSLARRGARDAASEVDGDFAIALREPSGRIFLAVDRFGIRTLCYRVQNGELLFAERADDLADSDVQADPKALYDYLYFHAIPSPRTIYNGVFRLPAAHYGVYEEGKLTIEPYWTPQFEVAGGHDFDELREEFLGLLRQAVSRQLDGTEPACFLSGGTDSSTVAGLIAEVTGQAPATYSIGFEAEGYDEMMYARIAARHFGTRHHEYYVTPDDLVSGIPRVAAHFDQPFGNSSVLPAFFCALRARDDGVKRLLAGDGGDELFGGNSRYAKQRVFDAYAAFPVGLRRILLEPLLLASPVGKLPMLRKGASYVDQARVTMPDRLQMYNLLWRLGPERVLTAGFLSQVDVAEPAREQRRVWAQAKAANQIDRTLAYDWRYTLAETDLPKVRGATQMAGIEVGFPLLDDDLLRFSMRLPADYKVKGLKLRWFFKEALRNFLPDQIIRKKKHGFGLPFGVWVTRHRALRELAFESLISLSRRDIVRPEFITELRDRLLPEHPGYYGEMVWILVMLEQWLQTRKWHQLPPSA